MSTAPAQTEQKVVSSEVEREREVERDLLVLGSISVAMSECCWFSRPVQWTRRAVCKPMITLPEAHTNVSGSTLVHSQTLFLLGGRETAYRCSSSCSVHQHHHRHRYHHHVCFQSNVKVLKVVLLWCFVTSIVQFNLINKQQTNVKVNIMLTYRGHAGGSLCFAFLCDKSMILRMIVVTVCFE